MKVGDGKQSRRVDGKAREWVSLGTYPLALRGRNGVAWFSCLLLEKKEQVGSEARQLERAASTHLGPTSAQEFQIKLSLGNYIITSILEVFGRGVIVFRRAFWLIQSLHYMP